MKYGQGDVIKSTWLHRTKCKIPGKLKPGLLLLLGLEVESPSL